MEYRRTVHGKADGMWNIDGQMNRRKSRSTERQTELRTGKQKEVERPERADGGMSSRWEDRENQERKNRKIDRREGLTKKLRQKVR